MNFEFKCPQCGTPVSVDESYRGQVVECPHCTRGIVVPKSKTNGEVQRQAAKAVRIQCPHCGTGYEVSQQDMHRRTSCEVCGKSFVIGTAGPITQAVHAKTATSQTNSTPHRRPFIAVGKNASEPCTRSPKLTIWIAAGAACMVVMFSLAFILGRHSGKSDSPTKEVTVMRGDGGDKPMKSESVVSANNEISEKSTEEMPWGNGANRTKKEEVATAQASNEKSENLPEAAPFENDVNKSNNAEHEEVATTNDETETTRQPFSRESVDKDDVKGEAVASLPKSAEEAIAGALANAKRRYEQNLSHFELTESYYGETDGICDLMLLDVDSGTKYSISYYRTSNLLKWPRTMPKDTAELLIHDRMLIDTYQKSLSGTAFKKEGAEVQMNPRFMSEKKKSLEDFMAGDTDAFGAYHKTKASKIRAWGAKEGLSRNQAMSVYFDGKDPATMSEEDMKMYETTPEGRAYKNKAKIDSQKKGREKKWADLAKNASREELIGAFGGGARAEEDADLYMEYRQRAKTEGGLNEEEKKEYERMTQQAGKGLTYGKGRKKEEPVKKEPDFVLGSRKGRMVKDWSSGGNNIKSYYSEKSSVMSTSDGHRNERGKLHLTPGKPSDGKLHLTPGKPSDGKLHL